MKIHVVAGAELTAEHVQAWTEIVAAAPALDSPFFRPEFTQAVAAVRDDVEVAVLEDVGRAVGFFPFQRGRGSVGEPVGDPLSDYHVVIAGTDIAWRPDELLRACGLKAWRFHNLLAEQLPFQSHHALCVAAPYIDVSRGPEAYEQDRRAAGSTLFHQLRQKVRQIERNCGPLRFVSHTADRDAFAAVLRWKVEQYRCIGAPNYLADAWTVALLERLLERQEQPLRGMLSALYAGDQLAAAHFGMTAGGVLHGWFPVYNQDFAKYSPGMLLWMKLICAAPELGIRRIDLGRGDERYKTSLMTGATRVAEGSVDLRPLAGTLRHGWLTVREAVRGSVLKTPVRYVLRRARRLFHSYRVQP
jgi:CelD/BcsL family acetyltransferase involved in cellulose biosynthesis